MRYRYLPVVIYLLVVNKEEGKCHFTNKTLTQVIHAGLYYGPSSLKTQLCLRGKSLLYALCSAHSIPHRQTGKWIVAQNSSQLSELHKIHSLANDLGVPTRFLSKEEAKEREPHVRAEAGVLESSSTGIVDSHSLMQFLEADFEKEGGTVACRSEVVGIKAIDGGKGGWEITIRSPSPSSSSSSPSSPGSEEAEPEAETSTLLVSTLINSAGLSAIPISNMILPSSRHLTPYYAKGTYFSYSKSSPKTSTLIYPAPSPGHAGLGTHLTLDLSGRIRFGPDVSWTDSPTDYVPNTANLAAAIEEIKAYLPGVDVDEIQPDYVGIRPKLGKGAAGVSGKGFQDFWIRKEEGFEGFVNLLGIESPGLTSALGIAERVEGEFY